MSLEKVILSEEEVLKAKLDSPADPWISFEETGIDYLVVFELHDYKNLRTRPTSHAQRSKVRSGYRIFI